MKKLIWSEELLDGGNYKTSDEWKKWCSANGWRLPTVKEYDKLFRSLKNDNFAMEIKKDLRKHFLITADVFFNPFTKTELVLLLSCYDNYFDIDAGGSSSRPARGVKK